MSAVVVVDYDSSWPELFESLRANALSAVADIALAVEHVGSTSVPGLAAKPIIDLDIVVAEPDVATAIERLAALGYVHRGDLGIPGREAFYAPAGSPPHHLYLCPSGSPALANHLAVRNYLRGNAEAVRAYASLKKRLAEEHSNDIDGYVDGKTEFLVGILRESGFAPSALADIDAMNRKPDPKG